MATDTMYEQLVMLLHTALETDCPVMSGNMKDHIEIEKKMKNQAVISISGPSYDIQKWNKTGVIEFTGDYDYAISVNNVGAFNGRSQKSKHWVNKCIAKVCKIIGNEYGAKVIVNVEL